QIANTSYGGKLCCRGCHFSLRREVDRFCEVLRTDLVRRLLTVPGTDRRLGGIEVNEILPDERLLLGGQTAFAGAGHRSTDLDHHREHRSTVPHLTRRLKGMEPCGACRTETGFSRTPNGNSSPPVWICSGTSSRTTSPAAATTRRPAPRRSTYSRPSRSSPFSRTWPTPCATPRSPRRVIPR